VKKIIEQYRNGELETQPGRSMQESFESRVNSVLNTARDDAGKRAQESLTLKVSQCLGRGGGMRPRHEVCSNLTPSLT